MICLNVSFKTSFRSINSFALSALISFSWIIMNRFQMNIPVKSSNKGLATYETNYAAFNWNCRNITYFLPIFFTANPKSWKILPHAKILLPLVKPQYPNYWGSANPQTIELYLCRSSDKCALLILPPICSWWQWLCSPCGCKRQAAS